MVEIKISINEENKFIRFLDYLNAEHNIKVEDGWATDFLTMEFIEKNNPIPKFKRTKIRKGMSKLAFCLWYMTIVTLLTLAALSLNPNSFPTTIIL